MLEKTWITIPEAAELVGCTGQHLRFLAKHDRIPNEKIGRDWLLERKAIEEMAKKPAKTGRPRKNQKDA